MNKMHFQHSAYFKFTQIYSFKLEGKATIRVYRHQAMEKFITSLENMFQKKVIVKNVHFDNSK